MDLFSFATYLTPSSIQKPRPPYLKHRKREANSICFLLCFTDISHWMPNTAKNLVLFLPSIHVQYSDHQSQIWYDKGHPHISCKARQGSTPSFFPIPKSLWSYQWFSRDFRLWNTPVNSNPLTHSLSPAVHNDATTSSTLTGNMMPMWYTPMMTINLSWQALQTSTYKSED